MDMKEIRRIAKAEKRRVASGYPSATVDPDTTIALCDALEDAQGRAELAEASAAALRAGLGAIKKAVTRDNIATAIAESLATCSKHDQNTPDFDCEACWNGVVEPAARVPLDAIYDYADPLLAAPDPGEPLRDVLRIVDEHRKHCDGDDGLCDLCTALDALSFGDS